MAHGNSPVGYRASGISFQDLFELALGFLVPEVVHQGDAPVDGNLLRCEARDGERDSAESLRRFSQGREYGREYGQQCGPKSHSHRV
jgi:hypothetical protein